MLWLSMKKDSHGIRNKIHFWFCSMITRSIEMKPEAAPVSRLWLTLLSSVVLAMGAGKGAVICGNVAVAETKAGIPSARIRVSGTVNTKAFEQTVSSDSQGEFRVEVPVGRYFLSAKAQGYTVARI